MLGSVCVYFDADAVLIAVGICAAVTLALTLFAFQVCSLYVLLWIDLVFMAKRILIQEKTINITIFLSDQNWFYELWWDALCTTHDPNACRNSDGFHAIRKVSKLITQDLIDVQCFKSNYFMKDAHINQLINLMTNFLDGQWLDTGLPALWSFHCILFMILNSWWEESTNILCLQKNMFSQLYRFTWILLTCSSTSLWLLERPEETKWERTNYFYLYTRKIFFHLWCWKIVWHKIFEMWICL